MAEVTVGVDDVWVEKDKDAIRSFSFNVAPLMPAGATLTGASWAVAESGTGAPVADNASFAGTVVRVRLSGGVPLKWYTAVCTWTASNGDTDQFPVKLFIKADAEAGLSMGSALFPNKFAAIAALKQDRILGAARAALPGLKPSDSYLWTKLLAAESEVARTLRVDLQPTRYFPLEPTQADIDALNGMPWKVDPAYDYEPAMFIGEKWGFVVFRNKPIIGVHKITLNYPQQDQSILDIPMDWVRLDKRYGQMNFVPSSPVVSANFATTLLGGLIGANRIPFALHIHYTAGLANAVRDYPELVDVVMKTATLKVLEDTFKPQSGSISADGLSQSMSFDMGKYQETIDGILTGGKGSNGGLMTAIHGIRLGVM